MRLENGAANTNHLTSRVCVCGAVLVSLPAKRAGRCSLGVLCGLSGLCVRNVVFFVRLRVFSIFVVFEVDRQAIG